jgi:hypothetical protein
MQAGDYAPYPNYGTYGIHNDAAMHDLGMNGMGGKSPFNINGRYAKRPPMFQNLLLAYFVPSLIFAVTYYLICSHEHYTEPGMVRIVTCIMLLVAISLVVPAFNAIRTRGESGHPFWYSFLFVASVVAWILATCLGDSVYSQDVVPYMDIQQLNIYPSVDPSVAKGQALMDGGRFTFVDGARLDLSKSMGFRSLDTYCVAPVSIGNQTLASYDFWAVGTNCCSGHGPDFACGEFNNVNAHSGLRLMHEDQRGYFRLAVQQAEATYNINANHPLFFYWLQDPQIEVQSYYDDGLSHTMLGIFGFFAAQLIVVLLVAFAAHFLID